jgi:hypothetical protein
MAQNLLGQPCCMCILRFTTGIMHIAPWVTAGGAKFGGPPGRQAALLGVAAEGSRCSREEGGRRVRPYVCNGDARAAISSAGVTTPAGPKVPERFDPNQGVPA